MKIFARNKTNKSNFSNYRVFSLSCFVVIFALSLIYRLFVLQILEHDNYLALASGQYEIFNKLIPSRGNILIRDDHMIGSRDGLFPLATNRTFYEIYAQPKYINDKEKIADALIDILGIQDENEKENLLNKISKPDDPYEPIMKKVEKELADKVRELNLEGIGFKQYEFRYYPEKNLASNILGFVRAEDGQNTGQYGIEGFFNEELNGKQGYLKSERDAFGRWIAVTDRTFKEAENGIDVVLTINKTIQYYACDQLKEAIKKYKAKSGVLIVMDPETGSITAMCNFPDFDPNEYGMVDDINVYTNKAVYEAYEPGSVFKPVTMAAALDLKMVAPDTTYDDKGFVPYNNKGEVDYSNPVYELRNYTKQAYGVRTMTEVLEKSLNTGTIFLMQKMGVGKFKQYVKSFGFGVRTGIELDTEAAGDISSLDKKGEIFSATASYGQGITTTPLQMISAYAVFANGGRLLKPYIVDEIINPDGSIKKIEPHVVSRPIDIKTAAIVTGMLVSVVNKGYDKKAFIDGYYLAGKTGTAQVAEGGEYGGKTIHTFVGYGPSENSRFVMLIKIDEPQIGASASETTAPLFGEISKFILDYYKVPPQR